MNRNPIISILTVLALVVAVLYPLPLHCCESLVMVGHAQERGAGKGCMVHEQARRDAGDGCNGCTRKAGQDARHEHPQDPSFPCTDGMSETSMLRNAPCGCFMLPHVAIDAAVLSSAGVQLAHPVAAISPVPLLPLLDRAPGEPCFKIGASPPFMADRAHYTYLRTSVFLI